MSNARSPREVCSTTIGTSGLTVQLLSLSTPYPFLPERPAVAARLGGTLATGQRAPGGLGTLASGSPETAGTLARRLGLGLLVGRPDPAADLVLLGRDGLGLVDQHVERAPLPDVLADGV